VLENDKKADEYFEKLDSVNEIKTKHKKLLSLKVKQPRYLKEVI
jgi:hypothetical protein